MTNVPASQSVPPPVPAKPNHANPAEYYLYEIWREQLKQSDILANQLKQIQAIGSQLTGVALGVTLVVLAVVVVPLIGLLLRFIGIRV
jgi:hypothetical protein